MTTLDQKVNAAFPGYTVRKDLVSRVRGNAAVPSYVLEFLLGQNCATDDPEQIEEGIERVRHILAKHYVQRAEAGLIRSRIRETSYQRVIDKVSVALDEKRDCYEATFENLGITHVLVDSSTVKSNERLLVSGVWCIADLSYVPNEARDESPFVLSSLKPIQMAWFDFEEYVEARNQLTMDEWLDVVVRSIGLNPDELGRRDKLFQLTRLVTYCERNYNFIELGPKGTGKSHVFSEFSPHGILISGGEVTPAKLFVNNSNGNIGLVGYWDCVAFDEFAGKNKRPKPDVVDIMKNYMANKSFSRGIETLSAEASMAFVGNTSHDVGYMIRSADLFEDLPAMYHDPAFIDRLHAYVPGWEMSIIRGDMFCTDFGLIVDYLAEALRHLRTLDYAGGYDRWFQLSPTLSTRDKDGVNKTFSGLLKILFPGRNQTKDEARELLEFAMEMRERVKDQLYRIDETFERVEFSYRDLENGTVRSVQTLEEVEWPGEYHSLDLVPWDGAGPTAVPVETAAMPSAAPMEAEPVPAETAPTLREGLVSYRENQRGVSYDSLFGPYLEGAERVEIIDPYVRTFHQCRNVMELMGVLIKHLDYTKASPRVHLITAPDAYNPDRQVDYLRQIAEAVEPMDIDFTWELNDTGIHARHLRIDDSWDILLDRGLDIWQKFDSGNAFALETMMPEMRRVKQFELTYLRIDG